MTGKAVARGIPVLFSLLVSSMAWAVELPDSEINPISGDIESVDTPFSTGFKVRHVVDTGQGGQRYATTISDNAATSSRTARSESSAFATAEITAAPAAPAAATSAALPASIPPIATSGRGAAAWTASRSSGSSRGG